MIERVVHPYNLQKAVEQVVSNKGSAGVDGIKTTTENTNNTMMAISIYIIIFIDLLIFIFMSYPIQS